MRFGAATTTGNIKYLPMSCYKLALVAQVIRGIHVKKARQQLLFCKKKGAEDLLKLLDSCVAGAENNHSLDIDKLYVESVYVGRAFIIKRFLMGGKGRVNKIEKRYSNVRIVLKQHEIDPAVTKKATKTKPISNVKNSGNNLKINTK